MYRPCIGLNQYKPADIYRNMYELVESETEKNRPIYGGELPKKKGQRSPKQEIRREKKGQNRRQNSRSSVDQERSETLKTIGVDWERSETTSDSKVSVREQDHRWDSGGTKTTERAERCQEPPEKFRETTRQFRSSRTREKYRDSIEWYPVTTDNRWDTPEQPRSF